MVRSTRGFTYLGALLALAFLGAGAARLGEHWELAAQRERETELLHVGREYRAAIERYYGAGAARYPRSLDELLADPRHPGAVRHLRRRYSDPITGSVEWGTVRAPDGGIAGVHSLSERRPLKRSGFGPEAQGFETAQRYADWKFTFLPASRPEPRRPRLRRRARRG